MISLKTVFLFLFLLACSTQATAQRFFEFTFPQGAPPDTTENFVAQTSNPVIYEVVDSLLSLPLLERGLHINGFIDYGNGGHNLDWSWHFIPDQWMLVHASIEICDGSPSVVEDNLAFWIDTLGYFCPWNSTVLREIPPSSVEGNEVSPLHFVFGEIYPNPFNPVAEFRYILPRDCQVKLEIYNLLGQRVVTLVDEEQKAGRKSINWDSRGVGGCQMASGLYFCRISAGDFVETRKMILLR